jgi:uncharacterized repeat protein (TIGR03803 family)
MRKSSKTVAASAAISLASVLASALAANAATFTVLHTFTGGSDGGNPIDGVSIDKSGNLYGSAAGGGANGYGTAFELKHTKSGYTFDVLYNFASGKDGAAPGARVLKGPDGHLYGTTAQGGNGGGTVFDLGSIEKGGGGIRKEAVLHSFAGGNDGYQASDGDLAFDAKGNIYGTTSYGGANNLGTVFELSPKAGGYTETILHSFGSGQDGSVPVGGITLDASGNVYGTTSAGGNTGSGTVYELVKSQNYAESVIYNFQASTDGETPFSGLTFDKYGNLYGGATDGGVNSGGVVFELSPGSGGWTFNALYSTPGYGVSGPFRTPYVDADGNVYGTTHCDGEYSAGSVYELTYSNGTWNYTSLHDFTGGSDGAYVFANPVFDAHGDIFGTTQIGGNGYGVVWEVSP